MLLKILLLNLVLYSLPNADADAKSSPKQGLEVSLENLFEKLEFRLREMERRIQDEKEKMELRLNYEEEKHTKEKQE